MDDRREGIDPGAEQYGVFMPAPVAGRRATRSRQIRWRRRSGTAQSSGVLCGLAARATRAELKPLPINRRSTTGRSLAAIGWAGMAPSMAAAEAAAVLRRCAIGAGAAAAAISNWVMSSSIRGGNPAGDNWNRRAQRYLRAPAPAYNPGTTYGGYNAVFDPRAPSSHGGLFQTERIS